MTAVATSLKFFPARGLRRAEARNERDIWFGQWGDYSGRADARSPASMDWNDQFPTSGFEFIGVMPQASVGVQRAAPGRSESSPEELTSDRV